MTKIQPKLNFSSLPDANGYRDLAEEKQENISDQDPVGIEAVALFARKRKSRTSSFFSPSTSRASSKTELPPITSGIEFCPLSFCVASNKSFTVLRRSERDCISGKPLEDLRQQNIASDRPYVFARAFEYNGKKKQDILLDRARLVHAFDDSTNDRQHDQGIETNQPMRLTIGCAEKKSPSL